MMRWACGFPPWWTAWSNYPWRAPVLPIASTTPPCPPTTMFKSLSNGAIARFIKDGWIASARHTVPWLPTPKTDYFADRWELYHVADDFSEAHDVSEQFPEKLKELQALFDAEALKYNIYPLGGSTGYSHPRSNGQRREFVFYPSLPRMPPWAAPDFTRLSPHHRRPGDSVRRGGRRDCNLRWALGRFQLVCQRQSFDLRMQLFRDGAQRHHFHTPLPPGKVEAVYEFDREDESNLRKGTGRLYINGQMAGQGQTHGPTASIFGSFNIGQARVSPVSTAYSMPFKFTGTIAKVRVELK